MQTLVTKCTNKHVYCICHYINFYCNSAFIKSEKAMHGILAVNESPRTHGMSHAVAKTSSTKRPGPDDKLKKRSSQISKELSDMVVYVQVSIIFMWYLMCILCAYKCFPKKKLISYYELLSKGKHFFENTKMAFQGLLTYFFLIEKRVEWHLKK